MAIKLRELKCKECPLWDEHNKKIRINLGTKKEPQLVRSGDCTHELVAGEFKPKVGYLVFGPLVTHASFGCIMPRKKIRG